MPAQREANPVSKLRLQPGRATTGSRVAALTAGMIVLTLVLSACGGSRASSGAQNTTATTPATSPQTATSQLTAPSHSTTASKTSPSTKPSTATPLHAGLIHAALEGENHQPAADRPWGYTVTATDAKGHPLDGSVEIEFAFHGMVVGHDAPPTHPIKDGRWHESLTFPAAAAIGAPIELQAVVHTRLGSVTLQWPVTVKR